MKQGKHSSFLGDILKVARLRQNMTQYDLADKVGKNRRYIQSVENDGQDIRVHTLLLLAKGLNVSAHALLEQLEYALEHGRLPDDVAAELPEYPQTGRPVRKEKGAALRHASEK